MRAALIIVFTVYYVELEDPWWINNKETRKRNKNRFDLECDILFDKQSYEIGTEK